MRADGLSVKISHKLLHMKH